MKKILSLFLSIIIFTVCCLNVTANNITNENNTLFSTATSQNVTPRYILLSYVSAGIAEESFGFIRCTSTANCMHDGYTFVLTCTLQRTDGSTGWVNYKTQTETFLDLGENSIEKSWFAPAGYTYRTHTEIVIKNGRTNKVVETATADSPLVYK
ncbi:MAG: hypothetical protein J6K64_03940 [Clostridia bacterium]|nr:hypothetical protein [Clostridia bacterium]